MRIISLVPSITESLIDLGCENLVGRTKFCIHPAETVKEISVVGGTKTLHLDKIRSLLPDLIIANKEENQKEQIEELAKTFEVRLMDVETFEDNFQLIRHLGEILNNNKEAEKYCLKIQNIFEQIQPQKSLKSAYLIWKNPYMSIGHDTFIHQMMHQLGFENIFGKDFRYPEIQKADMKEAEIILLSTEPYPFSEKHIPEFQKIYPDKKIIIVDGEAFSWYGTHIAKCEEYYHQLLAEIRN